MGVCIFWGIKYIAFRRESRETALHHSILSVSSDVSSLCLPHSSSDKMRLLNHGSKHV